MGLRQHRQNYHATPALDEIFKDILTGERELQTAGESVPAQVDDTAFKKWFGDSKVIDEDGDPIVVYHSGSFREAEDDQFIREGLQDRWLFPGMSPLQSMYKLPHQHLLYLLLYSCY